MTFIVDASIAASLFLPDEDPEAARSLLSGLGADDRLVVPVLFWYEMASILSAGIRKGRLDEGPAFRALEMLRRIGFVLDRRPIEEIAPALLVLAREHGMSSYDATYLELAAREGATLCTHDAKLRGVARTIGLAVLPAA